MARLSRCRAVLGLGLCMLPAARCSWDPRPLSEYGSTLPEGAAPGVRRFHHSEQHRFEDGTDLELHWEVDADPESILALDLEHQRGVRVLSCRHDQLVLRVPHEHAARAAQWRHVTASDFLHGCSHLPGEHLYHRVLRVEDVTAQGQPQAGAVVRLATEELHSPAQVFTHCKFYFNFLPASAKGPSPEPAGSPQPRELSAAFSRGKPQYSNSFTPVTKNHQSLLNLDVPKQLSNVGWNWDYDANATNNPQFKYTFPGGVGFIRLYKPYLKAHFGMNINFTSNIKNMRTPPHVQIVSELQGYANLNLDIATAVNFKKQKSASVLDDVLQRIHLPGLPNASSDSANLTSIKFFLGGTPLTVKPGISCKLKAYHIGILKGSLRVGLATKLFMKGLVSFDSDMGLQTNFSAKALDINFTPPTWMLFTQHFEMGMMLESEFMLKGGFGQFRNMQMGVALRPYFNVSIMQENAAALGGDTSKTAELAIYPFRAVGLPAGRNYVIKVAANGQTKQTASKMSTGVVEFNDNVEGFDFGTISQNSLIAAPIEVSILENGEEPPVATGQAVCSAVVNGICKPSPVTAQMQVDGKTAYVHLSVIWQENALNVLMSKIKSISLRFPSITITEELSQRLSDQKATAELRMTRNGHSYNVPLANKPNNELVLQSRVIYDLGPCFLESWKATPGSSIDADSKALLTPTLDLLIGGEVVGSGTMPPVNWDQSTVTNYKNLASRISSQLTQIPVMVPLKSPNGGTTSVGTGEIEIDVLPPSMAAFWVYPYQAESFQEGTTHTLSWVLTGGKEGKARNFTLTAMEVSEDGSLVPTNWQEPIISSCVTNDSVPINRYYGGETACLFQYNMQIPSLLAGKHIVLVASFLGGGKYRSPHWMVSTPVQFVSSRRLSSANANMWGGQSLGATNKKGFGKKVKSKLQKLKAHCSAQPLKYNVGAGMNLVERMKNVILPMRSVGGMSSGADWTSKPVRVFKLGNSGGGTHLSDILPKLLCTGGICEGMMPGCNDTRVNPAFIKQIIFKLSRPFRWKDHVGPKKRHIIAYGLALLPSVLEIGKKQASAAQAAPRKLEGARPPQDPAPLREAPLEARLVEQRARTTVPLSSTASIAATPDVRWRPTVDSDSVEPSAKAAQPGRRLDSSEGRWVVETDERDEEEDGTEYDSFTVRIKEPIHYELTEGFLRTVLSRGGFRGISDGREAELGPVDIVDFELVDPEPPAPQDLYTQAEQVGEGRASAKLAGVEGSASRAVLGMAVGAVLLGSALAVARATLRRHGYAPVAPADILSETRHFA